MCSVVPVHNDKNELSCVCVLRLHAPSHPHSQLFPPPPNPNAASPPSLHWPIWDCFFLGLEAEWAMGQGSVRANEMSKRVHVVGVANHPDRLEHLLGPPADLFFQAIHVVASTPACVYCVWRVRGSPM